MRFWKRNQYTLIFLATLVLCSVLVVRQYILNSWAHAELREDFILLNEKGHVQQTERLYQILVQELPQLPEHSLLDDYLRTKAQMDSKPEQSGGLVWKYHVSVSNELERRSEQRVARALNRAER